MKQSILRLRISRLFFVMMALILFCGDVGWAANPSSGLRVEISAAPNFVVDSNVGTPASYAPRAAYIGATFYNDGTNNLTDVFANIGKYNGGVGSTPGVYDAKVNPNTAGTTLTGTFALTHEGGEWWRGGCNPLLGDSHAGSIGHRVLAGQLSRDGPESDPQTCFRQQ